MNFMPQTNTTIGVHSTHLIKILAWLTKSTEECGVEELHLESYGLQEGAEFDNVVERGLIVPPPIQASRVVPKLEKGDCVPVWFNIHDSGVAMVENVICWVAIVFVTWYVKIRVVFEMGEWISKPHYIVILPKTNSICKWKLHSSTLISYTLVM